MAIRFNKAYNDEISKVVKNFNQKVNRLHKRGVTHLPERQTVAELKSRYESRKQLNKELQLMKQFTKAKKTDLLKEVETEGGVKSTAWNIQYLKELTSDAKQFYDRQIESISKNDIIYDIGRKSYVENLKRERDFLEYNIDELNKSDFKTYNKIIKKFTGYSTLAKRSYRGFMSEVEGVMRMVGIENKNINEFMEKFKELKPHQFVQMYNENNLIHKVYDIADSPEGNGELKLNTSKEDALNIANALLEQADDLVATYKEV